MTGRYYKVIIKGDKSEAQLAAHKRGISLIEAETKVVMITHNDRYVTTVAKVHAIFQRPLVDWFCEEWTPPPYPDGTLLYFGMCREGEHYYGKA